MSAKLVKQFVTLAIVIILIYAIYLAFNDFNKYWDAIVNFNWSLLPLALFLVLINFILREVKWNWFRKEANIDIPRSGSALIYYSGYSMCVSPARIGELIKPFMMKDLFNVWYRKSVPLVFCERLTDLLGMIVLCMITIGFFIPNVNIMESSASGDFSVMKLIIFLGIAIVFMAVVIGMIRWRKFVLGVFGILRKFAPASIVERLENLYNSTYPLLTAKALSLMTGLAVISWFFECWGVYVICKGFGIEDEVSLLSLIFMFCISSIVGGLFFFLPGGVGAFEVVMEGLLRLLGVTAGTTTAVTVMTRICTLFYGAALGFVMLFITSKVYHKNILGELDHLQEDIEAEQSESGQ